MIELKEVRNIKEILQNIKSFREIAGTLSMEPIEFFTVDSMGVIRKNDAIGSCQPYCVINKVEFVEGGRRNIFFLLYHKRHLEDAVRLLDKVLEDNL
jgi:hypothetical protein